VYKEIQLDNKETAYQNKYYMKRGYVLAKDKDDAILHVRETYWNYDEIKDIYIYPTNGVFEISSEK